MVEVSQEAKEAFENAATSAAKQMIERLVDLVVKLKEGLIEAISELAGLLMLAGLRALLSRLIF
jgi:hypothetical protein